MEQDEKNLPVNRHERKGAEQQLKTDTFSVEEQEEIVRMIKQDIESDLLSMQDWIEQRRKDIQMYEGGRPSLIENLNKEDWMSDRNLGLCAANCDAYQATLVATCYNIDTLHMKATEENDIDRKDSLVKFVKWGLSPKEADFYPEVDDFIHNKVTQGISYFHIYWKVWHEWVDVRTPVYDNEANFKEYKVTTERKRFEKGIIENIHDVSDLLFPAHGKTLQDKAHLIHRIKKTAKDIVDLSKQEQFVKVEEDYADSMRRYCYDNRIELIGEEKFGQLGINQESDMLENDLRLFPISLFRWYGKYTKNGKTEEYRFTIEPNTNKFLEGKPLRKITRSGKRPFVGRPFIRRPGLVQGKSLPKLIQDPANTFNNIFNQKSDFQYIENCPFFFYEPDEAFKQQEHMVKPGTGIPTSNPDSVKFPAMNRSLAWATTDFELLFEVIERLTGAASYFMSNTKGVSGTATRDAIINEKSDTRFGIWVRRIILDINEAITMWVELYQDWAPTDLGERILGEDGKKLFPNFSNETIRGGYDVNLTADIISGSRTLEKQTSLWALETFQQSPWFNPAINPKGSWNLTVHAAKKNGLPQLEQWMPPEPKAQFSEGKNVKDKWMQIKQGEMPEIESSSPDEVIELYMGFMELSENKRDEIDKEYLPNLDVFLFRLHIVMMKAMREQAQAKQANQLAAEMIDDVEQGRIKPEEAVNA